MSKLTEIGTFSYQRMDEMAVEIIHLKQLLEIVRSGSIEDHKAIWKQEDKIKALLDLVTCLKMEVDELKVKPSHKS
jgi:hypothetical protein